MGNFWIPEFDSSSSSSPSSTRPSSPGITKSTSNERTHSGTGSAFSSRLDEVSPNGRILPITPTLKIFSFAELKKATGNFRLDTVVGEGAGGPIFKGWIDYETFAPTKAGSGMAVTVKKMNSDSLEGRKKWQSEVNILGSLSHPNIVRLLGLCEEDKELLVYEFMSKWSLSNHIYRRHVYVKSDVYNFGVVLLELLSGMRALDTNRPSGQHNLVEWAKPYLSDRRKVLSHVMDQRLEGQYPSKGAVQAAQLILKCLGSDPRRRPSMSEVVETLEQIQAIKHKVQEPKKQSLAFH